MSLDLPRIRALCFDIDGTLSDTDDHMAYSLARRLALIRRVFPGKDPYPFARWSVMALESPGNFVYGMLDSIGLDTQLDYMKRNLANLLARRGWGRRPPTFWLIPEVRQTLERLYSIYPMAIVSARDESGTQAFLNQFQLHPFFKAVAHSQTCSHTKPFPDPIRWAAHEMGVTPESCLMIGDTSVDIKAGKAAGAQTVGVLCGFGYENELRRAGADLILPSTRDLVVVFEGQQPLCQTLPASNI
jgi:N-acetyl-D-muramate 6-phosphate phosphatase